MSNWGDYRKQAAESHITVTLKDIDLPNFWLKIRRASSYTIQEMNELNDRRTKERNLYLIKKVMEKVQEKKTDVVEDEIKTVLEAATEGNIEITIDEGDPRKEAKGLIMSLLLDRISIMANQALVGMDIEMIESWNLTHPETDAPLVIPKEDLGVLEVIPIEVLWHIKEKLLEIQRDLIPPKVRGIASS